MTFQLIPPQNQPVEEQSGATLDRTWYRFLSTLVSNALTFGPVPASNTAPGTPGQVAYDSGFFYVCIATNTWKRVGISSW